MRFLKSTESCTYDLPHTSIKLLKKKIFFSRMSRSLADKEVRVGEKKGRPGNDPAPQSHLQPLSLAEVTLDRESPRGPWPQAGEGRRSPPLHPSCSAGLPDALATPRPRPPSPGAGMRLCPAFREPARRKAHSGSSEAHLLGKRRNPGGGGVESEMTNPVLNTGLTTA